MRPSTALLWYVHDPMCSWCWGYRQTWLRLQEQLPAEISVHYLLGGLATDSDAPMPAPLRSHLQQTWQAVQHKTGATFNFDFWRLNTPRRSTYPACRAVIAAQQQNAEHAMILAIQQAYYLQARNPSDLDTLEQLAQALPLNAPQFARDLRSPATETELQRQISQSQSLPIEGFPSLVLEKDSVFHALALDYGDEHTTLSQIDYLLEASP